MKALTYFIHLAEKIRSVENPTTTNFKHAHCLQIKGSEIDSLSFFADEELRRFEAINHSYCL